MEDSYYDAGILNPMGALFLFYHFFHCVHVRDFTGLSFIRGNWVAPGAWESSVNVNMILWQAGIEELTR